MEKASEAARGTAPNWAIIPFIDLAEMTIQAVVDLRHQTVPGGVRVLLVDNGSSPSERARVDAFAAVENDEAEEERVLVWHHAPPLPSLAASWNSALDFVWGAGGQHALVVNNDVRLHQDTYQILARVLRDEAALMVTGVGVKEESFAKLPGRLMQDTSAWAPEVGGKGGPDFSCFLISKACHRQHRFDEGFIPAYHEDNDYHRRLVLAGEGARIFGVNVPFLHYGSRTINRTEETAKAFPALFAKSREHYLRKWGGLPGEETFEKPFCYPGAGTVAILEPGR